MRESHDDLAIALWSVDFDTPICFAIFLWERPSEKRRTAVATSAGEITSSRRMLVAYDHPRWARPGERSKNEPVNPLLFEFPGLVPKLEGKIAVLQT
jgi:hypothetical protein